MGWAYVTIMIFYALSLLLTLGAKTARVRVHREAGDSGNFKAPSPWRDLRDGFAYVWKRGDLEWVRAAINTSSERAARAP